MPRRRGSRRSAPRPRTWSWPPPSRGEASRTRSRCPPSATAPWCSSWSGRRGPRSTTRPRRTPGLTPCSTRPPCSRRSAAAPPPAARARRPCGPAGPHCPSTRSSAERGGRSCRAPGAAAAPPPCPRASCGRWRCPWAPRLRTWPGPWTARLWRPWWPSANRWGPASRAARGHRGAAAPAASVAAAAAAAPGSNKVRPRASPVLGAAGAL
mmetsp:Transcript_21945/g.68371  ORF Transcript_21945/g.68371 Transcript_21945/m.68371 type:complete len:210 (+) Transcript_21945:808-1437(+)